MPSGNVQFHQIVSGQLLIVSREMANLIVKEDDGLLTMDDGRPPHPNRCSSVSIVHGLWSMVIFLPFHVFTTFSFYLLQFHLPPAFCHLPFFKRIHETIPASAQTPGCRVCCRRPEKSRGSFPAPDRIGLNLFRWHKWGCGFDQANCLSVLLCPV